MVYLPGGGLTQNFPQKAELRKKISQIHSIL